MKHITLLILAVFFSLRVLSQDDAGEKALTVPLLSANFTVEVPGADMAVQFGTGFTVGGAFQIKTKKNILFGVEGNLLFGGHVKNQDAILADISTKDGFVIASSGYYADIFYEERGLSAFVKIGKIVPLNRQNPNSGLFLTLGPGYLQHKIRFDNNDNIAPQIIGEYKKGYDKLKGGFALSENIGYFYLGKSHYFNFQAGFEFMQAWTKALRSYDFNLRRKDTSRYLDLFYGIRVGWMIPLNKKTSSKYYYF